jgi:transcriptional regulator with XRE-family HTH domain
MTREEIKSTRTLRKLSQAALARLANLSASDISRIECGYRDLSETEAAAIAVALNLTPKAAAKTVPERKPVTTLVPKIKQEKNEPPAKPVAPVAPSTPTVAAGVTAAATPSTAPAATAVAAAPASKPLPTGSDLSDPANFGVLPDLALLTPGSLDEMAFRDRLSAEISRANKILHTPRVPAAVWRAWRQFEQQATERLRGGVPALEPVPAPIVVSAPAPAVAAIKPVATAAPASDEKHESKSFNSLFVEAARSLLPADQVERINRAAEIARKADASIGFMKHFRRIAEGELSPAMLKQVNDEANQRTISPDRWRTRRGRGQSSAAAR